MKELDLSLKTRWFYEIKKGHKKEEYREISSYWIRRLMRWNVIDCYSDDIYPRICKEDADFLASHRENLLLAFLNHWIKFEYFDTVKFTLGYPKKNDTDRRMERSIKRIKLGLPNKDWCPKDTDLNKVVIIIELYDDSDLPF